MSYTSLFIAVSKVGAFGFGGGPSVLPLLKAECVESGLVSEPMFMEGLAISNALPGPIATKMAVYIGYQHAGVGGAGLALFAMLWPSTLMLALLGGLLLRNRERPMVAGALAGVKPAVVGMLAWTTWELLPSGVKDPTTGVVAGGALVMLLAGVHPGWVMLVAAITGALLLR